MITHPLTTTLLDLSAATAKADFKLILGGGYGLYLRQIDLQNREHGRTLIPGDLWPSPRATEDLDLFLPTEIVVSLASMKLIRSALDTLGFSPVAEARFMHFIKPWANVGRVKIDLLTGPIRRDASLPQLKITPPRVRPRGDLELHAYLTEEAIDFDRSLVPLPIEGTTSSGRASTVIVYIPQPFTFLLMKLHAFADRITDADRDLGRHHALDVYRIIAMLTAEDFTVVRDAVITHRANAAAVRARQIVNEFFASPTTLGILRIREHTLFRPAMKTAPLINALSDLFSDP